MNGAVPMVDTAHVVEVEAAAAAASMAEETGPTPTTVVLHLPSVAAASPLTTTCPLAEEKADDTPAAGEAIQAALLPATTESPEWAGPAGLHDPDLLFLRGKDEARRPLRRWMVSDIDGRIIIVLRMIRLPLRNRATLQGTGQDRLRGREERLINKGISRGRRPIIVRGEIPPMRLHNERRRQMLLPLPLDTMETRGDLVRALPRLSHPPSLLCLQVLQLLRLVPRHGDEHSNSINDRITQIIDKIIPTIAAVDHHT